MDKRREKAERDFFITVLKEEARKVLWDVNSSADPDKLIESVLKDLEALAPREKGKEERTDEEIMTQVRERLLRAAYAGRPYCVRCGTCCRTGSPTLLEQDFDLFTRNVLKPEHVFTIRTGEIVYSEADRELAPSHEEMIKVKENPDSKMCRFFAEGDRECSIYEFRPAQCRLQECWNPESTKAGIKNGHLGREALLKPTGALWEIIQRHEERCSYMELSRTVTRLAATKGRTVKEVIDPVSYDRHVRSFVAEEFQIGEEALDFFLGRPLTESLPMFGLKVVDQDDGSFLLTVDES